jgi:hypothetical protein
MTYKLYFSNNDTFTVIDILDYSNITLAWGLQSALDIHWLNSTNQSVTLNHSFSNHSMVKSTLILTNESVTPFLNDKSQKSLPKS